jgi:hypothetical protein
VALAQLASGKDKDDLFQRALRQEWSGVKRKSGSRCMSR